MIGNTNALETLVKNRSVEIRELAESIQYPTTTKNWQKTMLILIQEAGKEAQKEYDRIKKEQNR